MALVPAESKIPALCIAHIIARRSDGDYPTPASNVLNLTAGPVKGAVRTLPCLEISVPTFDLVERRDNEQFDVVLDLHASDDTATTVETELGWLASIRRSFAGGPLSGNSNATTANTNAFMAYLAGFSDPNKAGWAIDSFTLTGGAILIDDSKRVIYRTTARCRFRSYVCTV